MNKKLYVWIKEKMKCENCNKNINEGYRTEEIVKNEILCNECFDYDEYHKIDFSSTVIQGKNPICKICDELINPIVTSLWHPCRPTSDDDYKYYCYNGNGVVICEQCYEERII
jgi:hypothetical protein